MTNDGNLSPPNESHSPESSRSTATPHGNLLRKWWPWVLAFGLLAFGIVLFSLDEQPPDIRDITFEPLALNDDENGYVLLTRAAEAAVKAVPSTKDENGDDLVFEILDEKSWDETRIDAWMNALKPVWPILEKASSATHAQAPRIKSLDDTFPEIGKFGNLSRFASLKVAHDLRVNKPEDAIAVTLAALRSASLLQQSRGGLITYLTAIAMKKSVASSIEVIARHPAVSVIQLRKLNEALEAARDPGDGIRYAMRSEIYFMQAAQREMKRNGIVAIGGGKSYPKLFRTLEIIGVYKPQKTQRIYAAYLRRSLALIATDQPTIDAFRTSGADKDFAKKPGFAFFNPENLLGRVLLNIVTPTWTGILSSQLADQSRTSALQAFVALKLYQREYGQFPPTLDALVPTYLTAVPTDYFDGAPIRYSAELGVVWSIGKKSLKITSADQDTKNETVIWLTPRKQETEPTETKTP